MISREMASISLALILGCHGAAHEAAGLRVVTITTRDFAFDAPDSIPAGPVRLIMQNRGPSYHHVQIVRLDTALSWQAAIESLPEDGSLPGWVTPVGGPEGADDHALPVIIELYLEPARYLLICRIHAEDGRAHVAHGMVRPLTVVDAPIREPAHDDPETTVVMTDFAFQSPDTLRAGPIGLRIENRGQQEHQVTLGRLAPGKRPVDVLEDEPEGAAPTYDALGGTTGIAPGRWNRFPVSLTPGNYILLCVVLERKVSGKRHYQLGMLRGLTVVERGTAGGQ